MYNFIDDNTRKDPITLAKQSFIGNILSFVGLILVHVLVFIYVHYQVNYFDVDLQFWFTSNIPLS